MLPSFADLADDPDPPLDLLALAIAAEFGEVDVEGTLATLDVLAADVADAAARTARDAREQALTCARVLGEEAGFRGDADQYDLPANSMIDQVLARRRGLPILLSVVYVEVARRAGIALAGVGLPGHYVVGHFGATPPTLLDPFAGGDEIEPDVPAELVRPWSAHETALRVLNNLVGAFAKRGHLAAAIRAAEMRMLLPAGDAEELRIELLGLRARLN